MAEIFIDAAFPYDESTAKFRRLVTDAVAHDGDMLKTFHPSSMMDWASFRDALRMSASCDFAPETLNALATAAETYAGCRDASQHARTLIGQAMELLDNAPVNIMGSTEAKPKI